MTVGTGLLLVWLTSFLHVVLSGQIKLHVVLYKEFSTGNITLNTWVVLISTIYEQAYDDVLLYSIISSIMLTVVRW